jgi:hypothetical protein
MKKNIFLFLDTQQFKKYFQKNVIYLSLILKKIVSLQNY